MTPESHTAHVSREVARVTQTPCVHLYSERFLLVVFELSANTNTGLLLQLMTKLVQCRECSTTVCGAYKENAVLQGKKCQPTGQLAEKEWVALMMRQIV